MTIITTRPNATLSNTFDLNGAASVHAALSDDDLATSISLPQDTGGDARSCRLGFAEPVIPAGAILKQDRIKLKMAKSGAPSPAMRLTSVRAYPNGATKAGEETNFDVTQLSPVTPAVLVAPNDIAHSGLELAIDAMTFAVNTLDVGFIYEAYWETVVVEKPVVDDVTVGPASPINNTDQPTINWQVPSTPGGSGLDPDGGPQTKFQVRVFTAAQYSIGGFDPATSPATQVSGTTASAAIAWQLPEPLADATYRAYVRVAQTINGEDHWSDWEFVQFVIDVDRPAVPTINSVTPNDVFARIAVTPGIGGGGVVSTDAFRVQRSIDGGVTWRNVRTLNGFGEIEPGEIVRDYEVPNDTPALYRVRAIHEFAEQDFRSMSAWATTASPESWTASSIRLKHPTKPDLNLLSVRWREYPAPSRPPREGRFQPLNSDEVVVISDTDEPAQGELAFRVDTPAELDALEAILADRVPLLMQAPSEYNWPDRWVRLSGQVDERPINQRPHEYVFKNLAWIETGVPAGNLESWT